MATRWQIEKQVDGKIYKENSQRLQGDEIWRDGAEWTAWITTRQWVMKERQGEDRNRTRASWWDAATGVMERISGGRVQREGTVRRRVGWGCRDYDVNPGPSKKVSCVKFGLIAQTFVLSRSSLAAGNHLGFLLPQSSAQNHCKPSVFLTSIFVFNVAMSPLFFFFFPDCFRTDHMSLKPVQLGVQLAIWGKLCALHF